MSQEEKNENLFEITVRKDKEDKYVIVEKSTQNEYSYIPVYTFQCAFSWTPKLEFKIINLKSCFSLGLGEISIWDKNESEDLTGNAVIYDRQGDRFSFFGSDKEIKNINVNICSIESVEQQGFDFFFCKEKEIIYITIYLYCLKYQKIKRSLEKGLIKTINCTIELANKDNSQYIYGLYVATWCSIAPYNVYKILDSFDNVENSEDLPKNFTKNSGCFYKNAYLIKIKENLFFGKKDENNLDDLNNQDNQNNIFTFLSKIEQTISIQNQSHDTIIRLLVWILGAIILLIILLKMT